MLVNESRVLEYSDDLDALQSHILRRLKRLLPRFLFFFPLFPNVHEYYRILGIDEQEKRKKEWEKSKRNREREERIDATNQSFFFGRQLIVHSPLPIRFNT